MERDSSVKPKGAGVLLDPLHRDFVPREGKTSAGVWTFETSDGEKYFRAADGSIRRKNPKTKRGVK